MTEAELRYVVRRVLVLDQRRMGWRERKRQKDEIALMLIEAFKHGVSVYRENPPHGIERIARSDWHDFIGAVQDISRVPS